MIWKKEDTGDYVSSDGRFHAFRSYDRLYGNHWTLEDTTVRNYYQSQYHYYTLKECKGVAETIAKREQQQCSLI